MSIASTGEHLPPTPPANKARWHPAIDAWIPKSLVCLRDGTSKRFFLSDIIAGLTVGVIAIPLALAFAIASHVPPERGLYTAIVAGFLVSLLGGSRVAIAGPTGAFVVIIAGVVDQFGYEGLALASLMAGAILLILGIFKFGAMIKFIPYPVTTGFTSGIALIIFSQQMKEFFGMTVPKDKPIPSDFVGQWTDYTWYLFHNHIGYATTAISVGSLATLILLRRFAPKIPSYIVAVVLATAVVGIFHLDTRYGVATIQSKFGTPANPSGIPQKPPTPSLPDFTKASIGTTVASAEEAHPSIFTTIKRLIPSATTIALLAAIESLLCAVVADGMIGGRHKSNLELCAQGVANIGSICFGGIPATGAIARTAANVKSGGRTPLAGIVHAFTVLAVMLLLAPFAGKIPLAALAAVLVIVAWNMAEIDHFRTLFKAPRSDIAVLLTTFGLTVFTDLTIAVGVGMVLASMLFMKRMSEVTNVGGVREELDDADDRSLEADPNALDLRDVPPHTEVYEITGPFFFGVADRLKDTLRGLERPPKVFILRMRRVPAIDASGMHALDEFFNKCRRQGTTLLLSGVHAQPMFALAKYGLLDRVSEDNLFGNVDDALNRAREIEGLPPQPKPATAAPEVAREASSP